MDIGMAHEVEREVGRETELSSERKTRNRRTAWILASIPLLMLVTYFLRKWIVE